MKYSWCVGFDLILNCHPKGQGHIRVKAIFGVFIMSEFMTLKEVEVTACVEKTDRLTSLSKFLFRGFVRIVARRECVRSTISVLRRNIYLSHNHFFLLTIWLRSLTSSSIALNHYNWWYKALYILSSQKIKLLWSLYCEPFQEINGWVEEEVWDHWWNGKWTPSSTS